MAFYNEEKKIVKDHTKKNPWFADKNKFKYFSSYNDFASLDSLSEK